MSRGAKKCSMVAVRSARSPSPQPSPLGRGRHARPAFWLDWVCPQFMGSMREVLLGGNLTHETRSSGLLAGLGMPTVHGFNARSFAWGKSHPDPLHRVERGSI